MQWLKFTVETTTEAEDEVCGILYGLGYDSVEIEDLLPVHDDIQGQDYEELTPDRPEDDGTAYVHFYVEEGADSERIAMDVQTTVSELRAGGVDVGAGTVSVSTTKDEDWANNWKQYFKPFKVGEKLVIKPSWEDYDNSDGRIILEIDPASSFGTGKHHTTRLCLEVLEKYLNKGDRLLDMGCGSGILSIGAMLLGASSAVAVDIDPVSGNATNIKRFFCGVFTKPIISSH